MPWFNHGLRAGRGRPEKGGSQAPLLQTKFWLSFSAYPHGRHKVIDIDFNNQNMLTRYLGLNHVLSHDAWALKDRSGFWKFTTCHNILFCEVVSHRNYGQKWTNSWRGPNDGRNKSYMYDDLYNYIYNTVISNSLDKKLPATTCRLRNRSKKRQISLT